MRGKVRSSQAISLWIGNSADGQLMFEGRLVGYWDCSPDLYCLLTLGSCSLLTLASSGSFALDLSRRKAVLHWNIWEVGDSLSRIHTVRLATR